MRSIGWHILIFWKYVVRKIYIPTFIKTNITIVGKYDLFIDFGTIWQHTAYIITKCFFN